MSHFSDIFVADANLACDRVELGERLSLLPCSVHNILTLGSYGRLYYKKAFGGFVNGGVGGGEGFILNL